MADRFFTTLALSVLLGFGAGAVGTLVATVYFAPAPMTVTVSPVPKATLAVNRVETKRLSSPEEVTRAAVSLFEAKSPNPLEATYLGSEAVGAGMALTSDGWIITQTDGMKTTRRGAALVAKVDGRLYSVTEVINDVYSGSAFFKIEARDLPVVALAKTAADFLPGDSFFALDAIGGVRRLEIANMAAPVGESAADLVRSSERLSRFIMTNAQPALPIGAMVLTDRSEVVGLISEHGGLGTLIVPIDAWRGIIDSVLKGNGPLRPYLGVRYLDLAEGGAIDADGRTEQGAKLTPSMDGKTPAVAKGSPADKVGLQEDDVILAVNGEPVSARKTLSGIVATYIPGMSVTVSFRRAGLDSKADIVLVTVPTIDKKP